MPIDAEMIADRRRLLRKLSFWRVVGVLALIVAVIVGGLAVFLAAIGLYGVIAFAVAQRTREFGIRLALGETPGGLRRWVVTRGLRLVGVSAIAGAVVALAAAQAGRALLYQVSPFDPAVFVTVALFLGVVGLAACFVPARRASRADPLIALRSE